LAGAQLLKTLVELHAVDLLDPVSQRQTEMLIALVADLAASWSVAFTAALTPRPARRGRAAFPLTGKPAE